jgi:hypothetical protein
MRLRGVSTAHRARRSAHLAASRRNSRHHDLRTTASPKTGRRHRRQATPRQSHRQFHLSSFRIASAPANSGLVIVVTSSSDPFLSCAYQTSIRSPHVVKRIRLRSCLRTGLGQSRLDVTGVGLILIDLAFDRFLQTTLWPVARNAFLRPRNRFSCPCVRYGPTCLLCWRCLREAGEDR